MTDDAVVPEPDLPKRRGRLALWGALAVMAVAIGTVAVVAGRDGSSDTDALGTRRLPIALGSPGGSAATAEGRAAGPATDMAMVAYVHYTAGDDLPALGGDGPAHRLSGKVDLDALRKVAAALGLSGEPTRDPDTKGQWAIRDGDRLLSASEYGGGQWWYSSDSPQVDRGSSSSSGGGSVGSSGSGAVEIDPVEPVTPACPPDADKCTDPMAPVTTTTVFVPPADLPARDEARQIALDLFAEMGVDLAGADITVDGPYDSWFVSAYPQLGGLPVSGYGFTANVGSKGAIASAAGILAVPEALGTYPTIDTRKAIDRLNDGTAFGTSTGGREIAVDDTAVAVAPPPSDVVDPAPATTSPTLCAEALDLASDGGPEPAIAPAPGCTPPEPPEPIEVVLHRAERILILIPASDGSTDTYLVPGYRLHGDAEGQIVEVPAIDDAAILPTPSPGGAAPAGQ